MTVFFSSDHHFGHANIIKYCNRPYADSDEMNRDMVLRWNSKVQPEDTVYYLGDFVMSPAHFLRMAGRLNGRKILIPGNHDSPFHGKKIEEYGKYFEIRDKEIEVEGFHLCHLPYSGDHDKERYPQFRPKPREGLDLLHGHCHTSWTFKLHGNNVMLNVGVDVHNFYPISVDEVRSLLSKFRSGLLP